MVGLGRCGVVLREPNRQVEAEAAKHALPVIVASDMTTWPFERALLVGPKAGVPWVLVEAGLHLVETWDAAAPLMVGDDDQHVRLASDIECTDTERKRTAKLLGDLRVPVYASGLLFVRRSEVTIDLIETWRAEMVHGPDERLAFVRALFRCKPKLCALPSIWTGDARRLVSMGVGDPPLGREVRRARANLVRVEYASGLWVQCHPGEETQVTEQMQRQLYRRRARR
jgi:hypothetical protein